MNEQRMPIAQHLVELRARLIICIIATLLAMIVAYVLYPDVFYPIVRAPLDSLRGEEAGNPFTLNTSLHAKLAEYCRPSVEADATGGPGERGTLYYQSLMVPVIVRLKVSLVIGIILVLPIIAYEIWAFVSAGLHQHEKRYVLVYGPASLVLFVIGAALAYFIVLPVGIAVLLVQGESIGLRPILTLNEYAPLVMWLLLGFGIVFQMPLVVLFLTKLGLVGPDKLRRARPYAILVMFILGAVLTPPDPFTQLAMAVPMLALYEFSILLSRFARRKQQARG